ncbi:MAG TPA: Ig-like domain-containing protein, partial [Phytomonospora sp.]
EFDAGSVTVTGFPDLSGELRVTATVTDEAGEEAEWPIVVTLVAEVKIPTATNDSNFPAVKAGQSLEGNVKNNDGSSTAPTDGWDVVLDGKPKKGSLDLNSDGSFTYKANAGTSGTDVFTYHLSKGDDRSNIATVTIKITAAGGGGGDNGGDDDNNDGDDDNNNGGDNNGGNNGTDNKADKDKLAKTGMSLPTVAVTGAGALGAGAVALWFTRRRKESGSAI